MIGRVVEIATDGVHLSVDRGFMAVSQDHERIGQVALDDIAALVIHGHGATWSANLTARLADRGVPMVICGSNHAPYKGRPWSESRREASYTPRG